MRQKCSKNVRLSTHSTPTIEVLSGERVGRFPRSPSKPAGLSRRDKASRARPPFESLSQALLGQAQLHKLSAVENMKSVLSYERAKYIMLAGRVIDILDRSLHRTSDCCEQHRDERWHSSNAFMNVFQICIDPLVDTIECR